MRKKRSIIIGWIILTLLIVGLVTRQVLATEPQREDARGLDAVDPNTLTLQESLDEVTWEPIIGNLTLGYSMVLDPVNTYEYLDIATLTADPALADGDYEFYFDAFRAPEGFWDYWSVKGVVDGATGWQGAMWAIISGDQPMFYLNVTGSTYHLIDGFQKQFESVDAPLRVNGDYPLGTYHFGGWVTDTLDDSEYLNIQITFTKVAAVSITPPTSTIEGCGYVDVIIHLADVHDLYAIDIELAFDPAVLEVVDLLPLETGINLEPIDTWFQAGYWVHNDADNTAGTIRYAATQKLTTTPSEVFGEGDIAKIRFLAKSVGESDVTITKAELSDRDGYLVGRPVDETDATITTQFTTAGGLALDISRLDAATVQLSWPKLSAEELYEYRLYRSTLPYFDILDPGVALMSAAAFVEGVDTVTYDDAVLGDVVNNYFYALQVECANGFTSPVSDQVGKFEFELFERFDDTDFTWIGLVLDVPEDITEVDDLAEHIQNNSSAALSVVTISEWSASGQGFSLFDPTDPTGTYNFAVNINDPYRIEIDLPGVSHGSAIWAQVGKLPSIELDTYTLFESFDDTDFTWILQPLNMVAIASVDDLATDITADSSPGVSIITISFWNPSSQQFETYYPDDLGSVFATRFGYPYRVEVNVSTGLTATWP